MSPATSTRLLVLACSATKRAGAERMPAIERYDGPLRRTLRTVDPEGRKAQVAFMSVRLGFRSADTPVEAYEVRMTPEIAVRMKAGGLGMRRPRSATQRRVMPFVGPFRDGGHLTPDAGVTEIDEAIGAMRRRLRLWLERNANADGEGR